MPTLEQRFTHDPDFALDYAEGDNAEAPKILRSILPNLNAALLPRAMELATGLDAPDIHHMLAKRLVDSGLDPSESFLVRLLDEAPPEELATELFDRFATANPDRVRRYLHPKDRPIAMRTARWVLTSRFKNDLFATEEALDIVLELRRFDIFAAAIEARPELVHSISRRLSLAEVEPDEHVARVVVRTRINPSWSRAEVIAAITAILRFHPDQLAAAFASGCGESLADLIGALDEPTAVLVIRAAAQSPAIDGAALMRALAALFRKNAEDQDALEDLPRGKRHDDVHLAIDQLAPEDEEAPYRDDLFPAGFHRRNEEDEARFAASPSGVIALKVVALPLSEELDRLRRKLIETWWTQHAIEGEWDLVLPLAAAEAAPCLRRAIQRASRGAVVALGAAGANAVLVELAAERTDAIETLIALALGASDRETIALARALVAAKNGGLEPPAENVGVSIDTLGAMRRRKDAEDTADQRAYAEAVLKAPRDVVLAHDAIGKAVRELVRLAGPAAYDLWIAVIDRPDADHATALLLHEFRAHEDRDLTARLAAALGSLPPDRLAHVLELMAPALALVLARSPKTPLPVRAHAAWIAIQREGFDSGKCDLSRDPELAAKILTLRTQARSTHRFPIEHAVREIARAAGDDDDRAADLRSRVLELCRYDSDAELARETLITCLWDQLRGVHKKGQLSVTPRKLRAWVEAVGWTRDRRLLDTLKDISERLQASEKVELAETFGIALTELHKSATMSAAGVIKLAFRSLA